MQPPLEPEELPQLWQRPSAGQILGALDRLQLAPPVWDHRRRSDALKAQQDTAAGRRDAAAFLSSLVKSGLSWLPDDEAGDALRERIWTEASRRLAERCGRAAMGELTRRWPFAVDGGPGPGATFELVVREPPLTGDRLGLKTWASSYLLATHLPRLAATSLFALFDESMGRPRPRVLELGAGTGLLGIAAAALWRVPVCLSDLPDIVPNLAANVEANRAVVEVLGGSLEAGTLTWGGTDDEVDQRLFGEKHQFKVGSVSLRASLVVVVV